MPEMQPERSLAVLSEPVRTTAVAPTYTVAESDPTEPALPLSHYLWILRRHGWRIAAFVAASVVATLLVSLRIQPVFESTATVDIDRQTPSGVVFD